MVSTDTLKAQLQDGVLSSVEYRIAAPLDLLDAPNSKALATQAWPGRHLTFGLTDLPQPGQALSVRLCEDDYPGWIRHEALTALEPAAQSYQASSLTAIKSRLACNMSLPLCWQPWTNPISIYGEAPLVLTLTAQG